MQYTKICLKYLIALYSCTQMFPIVPLCGAVAVNWKPFPSRCFNCTQTPSWAIKTDDWRKEWLLTEGQFQIVFISFHFRSHFILFCSILWQENETKGKGSLHTFYFKLQFIWASNTSVLFNSSGWYLSGFLKYNTH